MSRPFILGLTGSIGMGKSTTAQMFRDLGLPVWDADATVHQLYAKGGAAVAPIRAIFPDVIVDDQVDRSRLRALLAQKPEVLKNLENIVHPLTLSARNEFIAAYKRGDIVILDVPLLFETGINRVCDAVVVVSVPEPVQRARVLDRESMTQAQFDQILSRQMPDAEKRKRATYVIETLTLESTRAAVQKLVSQIQSTLEGHHA